MTCRETEQTVRIDVWRPARGVVWCTADDTIVLLSLDTGRYHTLRDTGAVLWSCLCEGTPIEEIPTVIAATAGGNTPTEVVQHDTLEFMNQLRGRQLIDHVSSLKDPTLSHDITVSRLSSIAIQVQGYLTRNTGTPSFVRCLAALMGSHILLRTIGLRRCLAHIYGQPCRAAALPQSSMADLARRVQAAAPWSPLRTQCLERSLCLLWLSRAKGASTVLRLGIQVHPFAAHAWVEYEGHPVNDYEEHIRSFYPFPALEPRRVY